MCQPQFENSDSEFFYSSFDDRYRGSTDLSMRRDTATSIVRFPAENNIGLWNSVLERRVRGALA